MSNIDTTTGEEREESELEFKRRSLKWITKEIRRESKRQAKDRRPCVICEKHPLITELHHIIEVAWIANELYLAGGGNYHMLNVWMCPNCHAYWHKFSRSKIKEKGLIAIGMTDAEFIRFMELKKRRAAITGEEL